VTLAVLRLIEEEAMKKGTERVIAHLPIDCATFLLNEKRAAIQELESRLRVSIVVLPSKHIETPAYDIERIKSLEGLEDKASHQHIKEEDITLPEFAKQAGPKLEKAAVKEFLPDAPAPVQNKKTSTSLIQRFWQRLIGQSKAAEIAGKAEKSGEDKPRSGRNNRRDRDRDRDRDRSSSGRNPRRNNKRPPNNPTAENVSNAEEVNQAPDNEVAAENVAKRNGAPQERTARRGRNRRRSPRNGGERKTESGSAAESDNQGSDRPAASYSENEAAHQPRPYASDFAERSNRSEPRGQESGRQEGSGSNAGSGSED
jgi:ribonuclease E